MKKLKLAITAALLCLPLISEAGFGGSRGGFSGGRSFSSARSFSSGRSYSSGSSFGGNRSTYRAPIVRPNVPSRAPAMNTGTTTNHVYHNDSGPGFFSGMLMGSLMSRPNPVVVSGGIAAPGVVGQPVVSSGPSGASVLLSIFEFLIILGLLGLFGWFVYTMFFKHKGRRY